MDTWKANCQLKFRSEGANSADGTSPSKVILREYREPGLVLLFEIWKAAFRSLRA